MKRPVLILTLTLLALTSRVALGQGESHSSDVGTSTWWHPNSGIAGKAADTLIERFNATVG